MTPTSDEIARMRRRLLEWFDGVRRDLPWRRTSDPYAIWISEVMLQQTQVDRVVAYFERFMRRFPTVESLAEAPADDVLKLWEGLGYYARARALQAAAKTIVGEHAGALPGASASLRALPGFGAYTSAAVASIAFGESIAAVDANVVRVVARIFAIDGPPARSVVRAEIERGADALLDRARPGDFNQAMMELGALVCRPRAPRCLLCPVAEGCRARASGHPERWPERSAAPERETVHAACGVVRRRGRVLVVRRPERGLLGGLWEFPGGRVRDGETAGDACARGADEKTGVRLGVGAPLGEVRHAFSHFRVVLHAFECRDLGGDASGDSVRWVRPAALSQLALAATARRVAELAGL